MRRRGFTLVEVVLALALVALVAGITFALLIDMGAREERVARHADRLAHAADLFETIERALAGSMVAAGDNSAGVSGGGAALYIHYRGVAPAGDDAALDMVELALSWDAASGVITCAHTLADSGASADEALVSGVSYISVRFYSGSRWHASFDSAAIGELPSAIEVAVWFGPRRQIDDLQQPLGAAPDPSAPGPPDFEMMFADEFEGLESPPGFEESIAPEPPIRAPDRRRIFAVPDAPRGQAEVNT